MHALRPAGTAPWRPYGVPGPALGRPAAALVPRDTAATILPTAAPSISATLAVPNETLFPGSLSLPALYYPTSVAYATNVHYYYVTGYGTGNVLVVSPSTGRVLTSIYVAGSPGSIVYDTSNHFLYVANFGSSGQGRVDVINTVTDTAGASIPLGTAAVEPTAIGYDPVTKYLYVADWASDNLTVVDPLAQVVVGTVAVGSEPSAVAVDPSLGRVYVANYGSGNVSIVNATTFKVVSSIATGTGTSSLDVDLSTHRVYVTNSANVSVFDPVSVQVTSWIALPHGSTPYGVLFDPARNTMWVGGVAGATVEVLNATDGSVDSTLAAGVGVYSLAYAGDRGEVAVVSGENNLTLVSDVSCASLRSISLGAAPTLAEYDVTTGEVYVSDLWSPTIWAIDQSTDAVVATLTVPDPVSALAVDPTGTQLLVGTESSTNVTVLNASSGAVLTTISLGDPGGVGGFLFQSGQLFVSESRGAVVALTPSTFTPVATFGVGGQPTGMVGDASLHLAYLINSNETNLTVFDSVNDSSVGSVELGASATGIAFQPSQGGHIFASIASAGVVASITAGTTAITTNITVPNAPGPLLYNGTLGTVFVSEMGSNLVGEINTTTSLLATTFVAGASPSGLAYSSYSGELYVAAQQNTAISIVSIGPAAVIPPFTATLSNLPGPVEVGQTTTFVVTSTLRPWALTYVYTNLPTGCTGSSTNRLACTPSASGSFTVHVAVTSPASQTVDASLDLVVLPRVEASLSAVPSAVTVGGVATVTLTVLNASGPSHAGWPVVPSICTGSPHALTLVCLPTANGTFRMTAFVSDSLGAWSESNVTLKVNAHPSVVSFAPSQPNVEVGGSVTFSATIAGGTAPFVIVYSGLPGGCVGANSTRLDCSPSQTGTFQVMIIVTDASGAIAQGNTTLNVTAKTTSATLLGLPYLDWAVIAIVVVAAIVLIALVLRRRGGAPSTAPASASPPTGGGAAEVVYGGDEAAPPAAGGFEAAAPAAAAPEPPAAPVSPPPRPAPSPPPRPAATVAVPPSAPRVTSAPPARPPAAGSARAPLKCANCGTMNEPWLTNCRWCKRPLAST